MAFSDDPLLDEVRAKYGADWRITREPGGRLRAVHREEKRDMTRERALIFTELTAWQVEQLSAALFVQQALRAGEAQAADEQAVEPR
ncbi:hypothetical protein CDO52_13070 [Nocardiopsis gilva YIM 90087]|uniref:Uncharacterized protein n=1 Tax=Nocardiopsis gilva YIM 90087 TaxID=1235441 RepID=A0A223S650_9ACTN|nr:hypothetical protein [Nocardiopsis gilva]ASU83600.1 hypothetical protein CDO52_13070 [Nocardiopsis gilva YIM 90087]